MEIVNAIGRRKGAVARVYATSGKGGVVINGKELKDYFPQPHIHNKILAPFQLIEGDNIFDWNINVAGGGFKGQARKPSAWESLEFWLKSTRTTGNLSKK